ncbi:MAG TPA: beta-N-acetylhexosaminidase [Flavobacteriales bacterium]|nr:beta-N-acetylhexosaminidase [Flavobacteriales bacterium]
MRYFIPILCLLFACTDQKVQEVNLIPKPQKLEINDGVFSLSYNTNLMVDSLFYTASDYLKEILNLELKGNGNTIELLKKEGLQEEEFFLNISEEKLKIEASTPKGIMRGIQTLRQLITTKKGVVKTTIPCLKIHDFPRFSWRGMLLDCCRHFMKKEFVMRYIDLLAYHKMNVLHWHLTEDQGWRIEIDKYPKLTEIGAWRTEKDGSIYGGFYTKEDIKEILAYAKTRHITVVPEIEFPGHSVAAIASYPYLSCTGDSINVGTEWGVYKDIYCAGNDTVFAFMEDVLTEVMKLFPSKYIHIGGDESPKYRWEHCKKCQQRMKEEDLHDTHELQSYFITRVEKFLNENGRQLIGWDEILEGGLAPSATVQSWRGEEGGIAAAKSGHDAIMSPTSHCYFDYGLDATDLKEVYHYEPIPAELTVEEAKHILGGECNMWSERAPQELVDSKVFPRILAMSEVLWSSSEKDYENFYARVQKHYPKLDALGVTYGFESVPITSTVVFNADSFAVSLFKGSPDMRLEYSLNNSTWQNYTTPFGVNSTSTLKARGFKNEKPYGDFEQEIIRHIATGKKVNYTIPFSRHYKGTGDNNLTDGLLGSIENFRDGYYQGFSGTDFEVIIDLGETTPFSNIQTTFFQYYLSWIVLPTSVNYAVSEDGKHFTEIETIANEIPLMQEGKFKHTFKIDSQDLKARYVKVYAKNVGKLPKEHPAAGSDAWIFVDEIIIN